MESFPPELQPFWSIFLQSQLPCIEIAPTPGKTDLNQSKFLGLPHLPKTVSYPRDHWGNPMILLTQLNFADLPVLEGYPQKGLLQIFISPQETPDFLYGADLSSFAAMQDQKGFQVRYYEDILPTADCITDFEFLRDWFADTRLSVPLELECELSFDSTQSLVTPGDYRFRQQFGDTFFEQFGPKQEEMRDFYWQHHSGQGHRLGGYAYFTQEDPRNSSSPEEDWLLLLQIDSDDTAGIMWGDVGVAGFFIRADDLARKDFSRVAYHWDCC